MKFLLLVFSCIFVSSFSFICAPSKTILRTSHATTTLKATNEEIQALAKSCLEEGCSVDLVDDLVSSLKVRRSNLILQLASVDDLLMNLEHKTKRKEDGFMEGILKSVMDLFSPKDDDYPAMSKAYGYPGEVTHGTKDAWDYNMTKK
mmetsp:Transcript_15424/g.22920  ORF Transcript_15424/g.22920 Transcript_15424/m.22920 type:complete len:147 (-) Transcript_15424:104-544(-)|eukprot:CAMPEP_0171462546 /NCGR_PEP_ID=MMETSP0945-20130129/6540_1 /TAXON_ID=109269 /ORGANISM="Vaucheria litorea, Strain CCMP2940" /LENGTH=146 /DNA_ID=CAMNT_0011989093 /DNA_START=66 /DNA_END=506 /DNA_ORIENTATION=+